MLGLYILLAHLCGDYLLQNDWMASEKTKRWYPALCHGLVYTIPYVVLIAYCGPHQWGGLLALVIIAGTHIVIDRFRIAKQFIWAWNRLVIRYPWSEAKANSGYPADKPVWMAVWLMIIVDNTIHLLINTAALTLIR